MAEVMPGTTAKVTCGGRKRLRFLPAAPEDERISALQPHDLLPGLRLLDQERVDFILRRGCARRPFSRHR